MTRMVEVFKKHLREAVQSKSGFQFLPFVRWSAHVDRFAKRMCGQDYAEQIDAGLGNPGWTKREGLPALYEKDFTEGEATHEVMHWWENAHGAEGGHVPYTEREASGQAFRIYPKDESLLDTYDDDIAAPKPRGPGTWDKFWAEDEGRGWTNPDVPPQDPSDVRHTVDLPGQPVFQREPDEEG